MTNFYFNNGSSWVDLKPLFNDSQNGGLFMTQGNSTSPATTIGGTWTQLGYVTAGGSNYYFWKKN